MKVSLVAALLFTFVLCGTRAAEARCVQRHGAVSMARAYVVCARPHPRKIHHARRHVPRRMLDHVLDRETGRPRAWCGWFMARLVGITDRKLARWLWVAANWARMGEPLSGPEPGAIGVMRHHVFKVIALESRGRVLAISGNDSHRVRTRIRSTAGVIAWRRV